MNERIFERAIALGERWQHVWISTTDGAGMPHIASVGSFFFDDDRLVLGDWSCPTTVANLRESPSIAIVVWDVYTDEGYQILGEVRAILPAASEEDGVAAGAPLAEKELWIQPHQVLAFSHAPHDDVEVDSEAEWSLAAGLSAPGHEPPLHDLQGWPQQFVYFGETSK